MRHFVFYTCGKPKVRNIFPKAKLFKIHELLSRL